MPASFKIKTPKGGIFESLKAQAMMSNQSRFALARILPAISIRIKNEAPVGGTGNLRNEINTEFREKGGRVYAGAVYSKTIEKGRPAKKVPVSENDSLIRWLKSSTKGKAMVDNIRAYLEKKGKRIKRETVLLFALNSLRKSLQTKKREPNPFFKRGVDVARPIVKKIIKEYHKAITKGLAK